MSSEKAGAKRAESADASKGGKGSGKEKAEKKEEVVEDKPPKALPHPQQAPADALQRNLKLLVSAVQTRDVLLLNRVLRYNAQIRRKARAGTVLTAVEAVLPAASSIKGLLVAALQAMEAGAPPERMPVLRPQGSHLSVISVLDGMDEEQQVVRPEIEPLKMPTFPTSSLPEVEAYLGVLAVGLAVRLKHWEQALSISRALFALAGSVNRRTLDPLSGRIFFLYALAHEKQGRLGDVRRDLLAAHRTACLNHNEVGQAVLATSLLRLYVSANQYDQAYKFITKTTFPDAASHNQLCRYMHYAGRVYAIQLDYAKAYPALMQALRKAPQHTGRGFRVTTQQFALLVQLLMGDVPERTTFEQPDTRVPLRPYLRLTQAVRRGRLDQYEATVREDSAHFERDGTMSLVLRLRHNVIKTGLRRLSLSYSRISFADVAAKLSLGTAEDAEFVCAKAVRDGVIDVELDHEAGCLRSKTTVDVYTGTQPMESFHRRITFCMDVRNEAIKAMRYPEEQEDEDEAKKRAEHEPTAEEIAEEIADELDEEGGE